MPDYRRTATGNWSTLAQWQEWNGSTWVAAAALPGAGDRCFANNFTTTLDSPATITVAELNNSNSGPAGLTAGGTFTFGATTTVNADTRIGTVNTTTLGNTTGVMKFINGNAFGSNSGNVTVGGINGSFITFNGTATGGGSTGCFAINIFANCFITGVFTGGGGLSSYAVNVQNGGNNNLVSGVFQGGTSASGGLLMLGSGTTTANGVSTGGSAAGSDGLRLEAAGILTFTGEVIGGTVGAGARNVASGTLIVTKATASLTSPGIVGQANTGITIVTEAIDATNGRQACEGFVRFSNTGQLQHRVTRQNGTLQLLTDNSTVNYPVEADVRNLVQYGPGNIYTGTLVVMFTPEEFLNAISVSPNPLAERMRNMSTVQTTGDQIAAAL